MIGPKEINQISKTSNLLELDLVPILLIGNKKTITVKDLINQIVEKLDKGEAYCLAVYARNLAELNKETAELALEKALEALALAKKAYDLAIQCGGGGSIDDDLYLQLLTLIHNLEDKVNNNSTLILNILNSSIKASVASKTNEIIYKLYKGNTEFLSITVPQYKAGNNIDITNNVISVTDLPEYTGSEHIDITNNVIGIKGLADVAISGNYSNLSNTPKQVSLFNNDAGYITEALLLDILSRLDLLENKKTPVQYRMINKIEGDPRFEYTITKNLGQPDELLFVVREDWTNITFNQGEYCTLDISILDTRKAEINPEEPNPRTNFLWWPKEFHVQLGDKSLEVLNLTLVADDPITLRVELQNITSNPIIYGRLCSLSEAYVYLHANTLDGPIIADNEDVDPVDGGDCYITVDGYNTKLEFGLLLDKENIKLICYPSTMTAYVEKLYDDYSAWIRVENITNDGQIVMQKFDETIEDLYAIYKRINYGTVTGPDIVGIGQSCTIQFHILEGYEFVSLSMIIDGEPIDPSTSPMWDLSTLTFHVDNAWGDIILDLVAVKINPTPPPVYSITLGSGLRDATVSPTVATKGESVTAIVTPNNSKYKAVISKVTIGGKLASVSISNNKVTIPGDKVTGNIVIDGSLLLITLYVIVTNNIPNSTVSASQLILNETNQEITVAPKSGYNIEVTSVTNNGATIKASKITKQSDGSYKIIIDTVKGNIVIFGSSYANKVPIVLCNTIKPGLTISSSDGTVSVSPGTPTVIVLSKVDSYNVNITSITHNGTELFGNANVTVTESSSSFTIRISEAINIYTDINICGTCTEEIVEYTVTLKGDIKTNGYIQPISGASMRGGVCYVNKGSNCKLRIIHPYGVVITGVTNGVNYSVDPVYGKTTEVIFHILNMSKNVVITGSNTVSTKDTTGRFYKWYQYNDRRVCTNLVVILDSGPITSYYVGVIEDPKSTQTNSWVSDNYYLDEWLIITSGTGNSLDPSSGLYFLSLSVDPKFLNLDYKTHIPAIYFQYKDIKIYFAEEEDSVRYADCGVYGGKIYQDHYLNTAYVACPTPGSMTAGKTYDISQLLGKSFTNDLSRGSYSEFSYEIYESDPSKGSNSRKLKLVVTDNVTGADSGQKLIENTTGSESTAITIGGTDADWYTLKCWCKTSLENVYCDKPGVKYSNEEAEEVIYKGNNPGRFAEYMFKIYIKDTAPSNASLTFKIGPEGATEGTKSYSNKAFKTFTIYK